MINKTKNYDIFVIRDDTRERITQSHVNRIKESISSRNLLELRPIIVNEKMEVIDGQHRLFAARELDLEIYYQVEKNLGADDVLLMNTSKSWGMTDYLNFYSKNGYPDYINLKNFMEKNNITLKVAMNIFIGNSKRLYKDFREGKFSFIEEEVEKELEICWETIHYIKKMNGYSPYTYSSRFWKALLKLTTHAHFDKKKWQNNIKKMIERFTSKATLDDYCRLMMEVYNYKNMERINLID